MKFLIIFFALIALAVCAFLEVDVDEMKREVIERGLMMVKRMAREPTFQPEQRQVNLLKNLQLN